MPRRQKDRFGKRDVDLNRVPTHRPLAMSRAVRKLDNAVHPVFDTETPALKGLATKLSVPTRPSRVAASISTSDGEFTRESTFPDGGLAESRGNT